METIERSQAGSPTKNLDAGSKVRITVRSAIEIAQNFFSRSQSTAETTAIKTTGMDVSRVLKLFVLSLEEGTMVSQNRMTQKELRCSEHGRWWQEVGWSIPTWKALYLSLRWKCKDEVR